MLGLRALAVRPLIRPKVFVSYATEDLDAAHGIADLLLRWGFPVWFDRLCLLPGDDWGTEIDEGVETSQAVVVLISTHSVAKTGYLNRELTHIYEQAMLRPAGAAFIFPVLLDGTQAPRAMRRLQWIDWRKENERSDLKAALEAMTEQRGASVGLSNPARLVQFRRIVVKDFDLDYVINLSASSGRDAVEVELGASAIGDDGIERFDRRYDQITYLRSGIAAYRRYLSHAVDDRLIAAVWSPGIPMEDEPGFECLAVIES